MYPSDYVDYEDLHEQSPIGRGLGAQATSDIPDFYADLWAQSAAATDPEGAATREPPGMQLEIPRRARAVEDLAQGATFRNRRSHAQGAAAAADRRHGEVPVWPLLLFRRAPALELRFARGARQPTGMGLKPDGGFEPTLRPRRWIGIRSVLAAALAGVQLQLDVYRAGVARSHSSKGDSPPSQLLREAPAVPARSNSPPRRKALDDAQHVKSSGARSRGRCSRRSRTCVAEDDS